MQPSVLSSTAHACATLAAFIATINNGGYEFHKGLQEPCSCIFERPIAPSPVGMDVTSSPKDVRGSCLARLVDRATTPVGFAGDRTSDAGGARAGACMRGAGQCKKLTVRLDCTA